MISALDENVLEIQSLYPKIYLACHLAHQNARSSSLNISNRDCIILAHLFDGKLSYNKQLAQHLNVAPSTMSEALNHLVSLKLVEYCVDAEDQRRTKYRLTAQGQDALQASSVLNTSKLTNIIDKLSKEEQDTVIKGLRLLAGSTL